MEVLVLGRAVDPYDGVAFLGGDDPQVPPQRLLQAGASTWQDAA
ncbi:hypothetical protein [Streptomyces sp. NPDC102283]